MHRVMVTGFARQAAYLATLLSEHAPGVQATYYPTAQLSRPRALAAAFAADAFITVGGPRPHGIIRKILSERARAVIVIWVGTDVLNVSKTPELCEALAFEALVHWSCSAQLVNELDAFGIRPRYVPIVSATVPRDPPPFPETFTVLAYLPQPRRGFYGEHAVWQAAQAIPEAHFIVVGAGQPDTGAPPNVRYAGEVADINSVIDRSTVLFRITEHDGQPAMAVECLARGRHVICSVPLAASTHVRSAEEGIRQLRSLYEAHRAGELTLNYAGMAYIEGAHTPTIVGHGLSAALRDAAAQAYTAARTKAQRDRVVISGSDVLSARVARNWRAFFPQYAPALLCTASRSEVAVSAFELASSRAWYTIGEHHPPALFELIALALRKPRLVHWLAHDVDILVREPKLLQKYRSRRFVHFAADEQALIRLRALGVRCRLAPVSPGVTSAANSP